MLELMKKLYGTDEVMDDPIYGAPRKTGTNMAGSMAELPPSAEAILLQDEQ